MEKVKYYQIAFKGVGVEQIYKKLVSPTRTQIDELKYTAENYLYIK